ncbi:MAG: PKD domain-containing protein [Chitinophagaceae bacterium]|nr:PKD domain-containing protein [Chitinophagaceae bacterium]
MFSLPLYQSRICRRKLRSFFLLQVLLLFVHCLSAQDFSNKGKDFWLGYGDHVRMHNAGTLFNTQDMKIYITSDVNTSGVVEIPGLGWSTPFAVTANQVYEVLIPKTGVYDARLNQEGLSNKGIHIKADRPVVAYAHIYNSAVSGSTLCLPTNTLGREYYSVNYTQQSNEAGLAYSWFFVVATDDNTTVEITPSTTTAGGWMAGNTYTVNLQKGQVYNVLSLTDLTGSRIRSVATGLNGCKKIAVFCGSGKISLPCDGGSSDNFIQQIYPVTTWGRKYVTAPSATRPLNYYRIIRPDALATVTLNGTVIPNGSYTSNFYYEFSGTTTNVIESDKPILVSQYFSTQQCAENTGYGDPEMIYVNPVEQTISDVTLQSMQLVNPGTNLHYLNVVLKNDPAVYNSFRIDGVPFTNFQPVPQDPAFAYAQISVTQGAHRVKCDSGFNAIAYGFAPVESYGYSAGTNLRDLYQYVLVNNVYGTVNFPAGCKNSPFTFSMVFPYEPLKITWKFNGLFPDTTLNSPVYDSSWVVDGKTLYRYKLNRSYTIANTGTYPVTVVAINPTADGCSGEQDIEYELQVFDPPVADFNFTSNGCLADSVHFFDATTQSAGRPVIRWHWNFDDGQVSDIKNPAHKFLNPGNYNVKLAVITDVGCLSDTAKKTIVLSATPSPAFTTSAPLCINGPVTFTNTTVDNGATITMWYWDYGDGAKDTLQTGVSRTHTYTNAGNYTVSLKAVTNTGCESPLYSRDITIRPEPAADFGFGNICLPGGLANYTNLSSISDGTESQFTYLWNFGDPNANAANPNTSLLKDGVHYYSGTGPYDVKLTVTSVYGCTADTIKQVNTIIPQPKASFTLPAEICFGDTAIITLNVSGNDGTPFTSIHVDTDGNGFPVIYNNITPGTQTIAYKFVPATAGNKTVRVFGIAPSGCNSDTMAATFIVRPLPIPYFTTSVPSCETKDIAFTDASVAGAGTIVKWSWDFGDGTSDVKTSGTLFKHSYLVHGTYNVTLTVETDKGCRSVAYTKQVKVNPLPVADFILPEVCLSDASAQFVNSSSIADGSENQFSFLWTFSDGGSTIQRHAVHKYNATGNYTVSLMVTSKDGCISTVSKPFTVNGDRPKADFTINDENKLCSNREVVIRNTSAVNFGKITRVEIYWDYNNDPISKTIDDDPSYGKEYSFKYPDFSAPAIRTFHIRYIAYSGISCISSVSKTISVNAMPDIQFSALTDVCNEAVPFAVTQAKEASGLAGSGIFSGIAIDAAGIFNPAAAGTGTHVIRYTFNAGNGCSAFKEQSIRVNPTPRADAGPDRVILEGGFITINASAGGNAVSYQWAPPTGLDNPTVLNPKASPKEDITYILTVQTPEGCKASDQVFIKVLKTPVVPNTFTPNGDGYNDRWEIQFLNSYPGNILEVYNPQGQLLFRAFNYNNQWDGTSNGRPLPVGTYYYVIDPKNGRNKITGYVTILR